MWRPWRRRRRRRGAHAAHEHDQTLRCVAAVVTGLSSQTAAFLRLKLDYCPNPNALSSTALPVSAQTGANVHV